MGKMKDWKKEFRNYLFETGMEEFEAEHCINIISGLLAEQKKEIEDKMNFEVAVGERADKNVKEAREKERMKMKLFPQCPECKKLTGGFCPEHSKTFMRG